MRRLAMALGVMAAVLFVAGVSAQNKKDFTGKWTPDAEKNGGRGGGASDFEIKMDDKTVSITTTRTPTMSYKLDGSESKNTVNRGGTDTVILATAKWDGDKLVIVTKGANGNTTRKYFMEGADLVRESIDATPAGGKAPDPTRLYFKRVQS